MHSPDSREFQRYWTGDRIDRSFAANAQRLMIGLAVADDWSHINGCLAIASGRGKHLRLKHAVDDVEPVPDELAELLSDRRCAGLGQQRPSTIGTDPSLTLPARGDVARSSAASLAGHDLAACEAALVARLSAAAGKYVERILAVAVTDPGCWSVDFDGSRVYQPGGDAARLAELTGLNIVDGFPARDLAAGGNGEWLKALPCWFLFADRRERHAVQHSLLVMTGSRLEWVFLPGSDGLDELMPDIRAGWLGVRPNPDWQQLAANIRAALPIDPESGQHVPLSTIRLISSDSGTDLGHALVAALEPDIPACVSAGLEGGDPLEAGQLNARVASLLGLMFADQMPQNLPALTGAAGLRMLGQLVPGKPFSFSNLVASMADSQVSSMRLRDAV